MYPRVDETKQILPFFRVLTNSLLAAYLGLSDSLLSKHKGTYPCGPCLYPVSHIHSLNELLLGHFDEELGFGSSSAEEDSIRSFSIVANNHSLESPLRFLCGSQGVGVVSELLVVRLAGVLKRLGQLVAGYFEM